MQFRLLISLYRSKEALKPYVHDHELLKKYRTQEERDTHRAIFADLLDNAFWNDISDAKEVFRFIFEQQKTSESTYRNLEYVGPRWLAIQRCLVCLSNCRGFKPANDLRLLFQVQYNASIFQKRFESQVWHIHWAAYHLDPANQAEPCGPVWNHVLQFL